jgi:DNA uptake protein ComE-like DNA-binding protein
MLLQRIKSLLRDYFTLTSRERKGAISLATLNFILIGWILWNNHLFPSEPVPESYFTPEFHAFESALAVNNPKGGAESREGVSQTELRVTVAFDPNTLSDSGWLEMGLKARQVRTIRNYLSKGGRFKKPEDLGRIYGLDPGQYEQMFPYIAIEPDRQKSDRIAASSDSARRPKPLKIDLNLADTTELAKLPLVGAGRARMIWKYREKIGGFHVTNQLLEVYTIDTLVYEAIRPHVKITGGVRKFNVNADTLKHHYLPRNAARALVAYRRQHGSYMDTGAVKAVGVIADSSWLKLAPYIGFE